MNYSRQRAFGFLLLFSIQSCLAGWNPLTWVANAGDSIAIKSVTALNEPAGKIADALPNFAINGGLNTC